MKREFENWQKIFGERSRANSLILQGNELKIGDLEGHLSDSMSPTSDKVRNVKMMEDDVLKVKGKIKGAWYSVVERYAHLRGDFLTNEVVNYLRKKYE